MKKCLIVLYNINDKDTTNIVSLLMNVGFNTYGRWTNKTGTLKI
jgi:hypothetical protein